MFFRKKDANIVRDKDLLREIFSALTRIEQKQDKLLKGYDRLNDTIVEHFEGYEDLGEISKMDV